MLNSRTACFLFLDRNTTFGKRLINDFKTTIDDEEIAGVYVISRFWSIEYWKVLFGRGEVIVTSPFFKSFFLVLIARLFRCQVVAMAWDKYPVMLGGKRLDNRRSRRIADWLEGCSLGLCHRVVVPTSDFLPHFPQSNVSVARFWPHARGVQLKFDKASVNCPIHIVFAGQVNITRGLGEVIERLDALAIDYRVSVASCSDVPSELKDNSRISWCGHLCMDDLQNLITSADFGLVSIAKNFEGPAFPSKSLDYLSNFLPIIYWGPELEEFCGILRLFKLGVCLDDPDDKVVFELNNPKKLTACQVSNFNNFFGVNREGILNVLERS